MQVGLGLVAAYEDGLIYERKILEVDEKEYLDNVNLAAVQAFNLAFDINYITKDNVDLFISKAYNDAKALGIYGEIFDEGIIEDLLGKAEISMLSLKDNAKIVVPEKPKGKVEEKQKEQVKKKDPLAVEKVMSIPDEKKEVKKELEVEKKDDEINIKQKIEEKEENILEEEKTHN